MMLVTKFWCLAAELARMEPIIFSLAYFLLNSSFWSVDAIKDTPQQITAKCRDLMSCIIKNNCVQLEFLQKSFDNATISKKLYDYLDRGVDYGCIFASGCLKECNKCPLCETSKQQLIDVLAGNRRNANGECSVLVNCASECLVKSGSEFTKINYCLRHQCAFHCFDGSCQKCAGFVTRIFNQICASGELLKRVPNFKGYCHEMFRSIVSAKFKEKFEQTGKTPSIGVRNG